MGPVSTVHEGTGISGIVHDLVDDRLRRGLPAQLAGFGSPGLASGHEDPIIPQAAQHPLAAAQLGKPPKDELESALHLQIGILGDLAVRKADQAGRHLVAILAALDPAHPAFLQP
jgi:hypothetical protein